MFTSFLSRLLPHWELLLELTKREVKQRYKQSVLGYAWVLLNPTAQLLVLTFVFSRILPPNSVDAPYPLFLLLGVLPWTFTSTTLTTSTSAFLSNGKLIKKIALPRQVFVQSVVLAKFVDFFWSCSLLLLLFWWFGIVVQPNILFVIPVLLLQVLFLYGMSLIIATLNVFYRDIQYLLNFLLMVWMYITPIMYPTTLFPDTWQWIFTLNPMAVFVTAYRQIIFEGKILSWEPLAISGCIVMAVLSMGWFVFKKNEGRFADVI